MKEITSIQNPIIKEVHSLQQKKYRNELGLFLIEGYKGVTEAISYGLKIDKVFISQDFNKSLAESVQDITYKVPEAVMKKISTTDSPPEIIAVARQLEYKTEDLFKDKNPLILVLENIKDPGNLGTIIRTAKASYVSGFVLTDETVDIYNPKTVRSSAANLWKLPIIHIPDKKNLKKILNKNLQFIATVVTDSKNQKLYYNADYTKPTVIMFGSEAEGLSEELINQSDMQIKIPMDKQVESLNLSISVGVILYESLRQRKCL